MRAWQSVSNSRVVSGAARRNGSRRNPIPARLFRCNWIRTRNRNGKMRLETVVIKFGGTSVGSLDRIKSTGQRVAEVYATHKRLVVVVSAMSGQTDRLLEMGRTMSQSLAPETLRELDSLAATGEQVSAALLALALQQLGLPACSLTAHQVTIATDGHFQRARIKHIDSKPLVECLDRGVICVVTGFQGTDGSGSLVTLGRGGRIRQRWH